jgi:hypothetical protein
MNEMRKQYATEEAYFEEILTRALKYDSQELLKNVPQEDILRARKYMDKKLTELFRNLKKF